METQPNDSMQSNSSPEVDKGWRSRKLQVVVSFCAVVLIAGIVGRFVLGKHEINGAAIKWAPMLSEPGFLELVKFDLYVVIGYLASNVLEKLSPASAALVQALLGKLGK